jgi:hypothetical protein
VLGLWFPFGLPGALGLFTAAAAQVPDFLLRASVRFSITSVSAPLVVSDSAGKVSFLPCCSWKTSSSVGSAASSSFLIRRYHRCCTPLLASIFRSRRVFGCGSVLRCFVWLRRVLPSLLVFIRHQVSKVDFLPPSSVPSKCLCSVPSPVPKADSSSIARRS